MPTAKKKHMVHSREVETAPDTKPYDHVLVGFGQNGEPGFRWHVLSWHEGEQSASDAVPGPHPEWATSAIVEGVNGGERPAVLQ